MGGVTVFASLNHGGVEGATAYVGIFLKRCTSRLNGWMQIGVDMFCFYGTRILYLLRYTATYCTKRKARKSRLHTAIETSAPLNSWVSCPTEKKNRSSPPAFSPGPRRVYFSLSGSYTGPIYATDLGEPTLQKARSPKATVLPISCLSGLAYS